MRVTGVWDELMAVERGGWTSNFREMIGPRVMTYYLAPRTFAVLEARAAPAGSTSPANRSASSDQGRMWTMNESSSPAMGHRVLPHTADLIIEAWGPSRVVCLEEAARALVDSFASIEEVPVTEPVRIQLEQDGDEALLVSLLEEIIYVVDVLGGIPIRVTLEETHGGGIAGVLEIAPVDALEIHGSLPKGVSFTDLAFARSDGSWRCHVTIDV